MHLWLCAWVQNVSSMQGYHATGFQDLSLLLPVPNNVIFFFLLNWNSFGCIAKSGSCWPQLIVCIRAKCWSLLMNSWFSLMEINCQLSSLFSDRLSLFNYCSVTVQSLSTAEWDSPLASSSIISLVPSKSSSRPCSFMVLAKPRSLLHPGQFFMIVLSWYHVFIHESHPRICSQHFEAITGGLIYSRQILHRKPSISNLCNAIGILVVAVKLNIMSTFFLTSCTSSTQQSLHIEEVVVSSQSFVSRVGSLRGTWLQSDCSVTA